MNLRSEDDTGTPSSSEGPGTPGGNGNGKGSPRKGKTDPFELGSDFRTIEEKIEELAVECDLPYIDAALAFCERNGLEIEFVGEVIKQSETMRTKIQVEAEALHFLKETEDRLPM